MKECNKCERLFEKALYGELTNSEKELFNSHMNICKKCAGEFEELKETLKLVKMQSREEADESFMHNFWTELEPGLQKNKQVVKTWWLNILNAFQFDFNLQYKLAGAAVVLIFGIFIGRYLLTGQENVNPALYSTKEIKEQKLNMETAKYIERSKILLLGLMNFDPAMDDAETISLPHIKKISRELLNEVPGLKSGLKDSQQQQLSKLVSDLELILMQIANLEVKNDIDGIELIKDGVNSRGIFLKINIQELLESNKGMNNPENQNKEIKKENRKI